MNDLHKQGKETDGAYDTQKKQIIMTMKRNFKGKTPGLFYSFVLM